MDETNETLVTFMIFIENQITHGVLTLTNGLDKMYQVALDKAYLDQHRERTGIEGTWLSYMTLLKQAFEQKALIFDLETLVLKIQYPLMKGARITGKMDLSQKEVKGRERHEKI